MSDKSLQIEKYAYRLNQWEYLLRMLGFLILILIILASLLGFFGGQGVFSDVKLQDTKSQFQLSYHQFAHQESDEQLILTSLSPTKAPVFWLESAYLRGVEIKQIYPPPSNITYKNDKIFLSYNLAAPEPLSVIFSFNPHEFGFKKGKVGLGEHIISFTQFIYP